VPAARAPPQVERYVLRLLGAAQRRRAAAALEACSVFGRQDAAFRWADDHAQAAELRCAPARAPPACAAVHTPNIACKAAWLMPYCAHPHAGMAGACRNGFSLKRRSHVTSQSCCRQCLAWMRPHALSAVRGSQEA